MYQLIRPQRTDTVTGLICFHVFMINAVMNAIYVKFMGFLLQPIIICQIPELALSH